MMAEVKLLGIRHHGPGSALRLNRVLEEWSPDIVLLEAPADAQSLLASFDPYIMRPPIAGLIYDPKEFKKSAYFPLAEFSPEWCALKYSFDQKLPVRCIDLPIGAILKKDRSQVSAAKNPFHQLASISGFNDVEQWWDHFLENSNDHTEVFDHIAQLMRELRKDSDESTETKEREAFMVNEIQAAKQQGFEKIAVVCGAYHLPALENHASSKSKKKFKSPKSIKTEAVWIPWSYRRMTQDNGYGAGVLNPTWYHALFSHKEDAPSYWLTQCAQIFRSVSPLSTAHTIETIRLAHSLKQLRQKNSIGIPELEDSITAVMHEGDPKWKEIYGEKIFTGDLTGYIPNQLFTLPIQLDFRKNLTSARLGKVLESPDLLNKSLDLRSEKHLAISYFLCQTLILNIPLAKLHDASEAALGNFKENWDLQWDPVSEWVLIQVASLGNTIESAAQAKIMDSLAQTESIEDIIELLDQSFLCGFQEILEVIKPKLFRSFITNESVYSLLKSINSLLHVQSYGHIRWVESPDLMGLIDRMVYKVSLMLPTAVYSVNKEEIDELKQLINRLYFSLQSGNFPELTNHITEAWIQIFQHHSKIDYFSGRALRVGMDMGFTTRESIDNKINFVFTTSQPNELIQWLEGLFSGGILWLLYDDIFLEQLSNWMDQMDSELFYDSLPMLRRTFGLTPQNDRSALFFKIKHGHNPYTSTDSYGEIKTEAVHNKVIQLMDFYNWK